VPRLSLTGLSAILPALLLTAALPVGAQEFPTRPITIIAAGAPGLPVDIISRTLSPAMAQNLGQSVVVENKLGAGSLIGYEYAAKRPPDGYTIAVVSVVQLASLPASTKDLRFDPLKDLPPFIGIGDAKVVLTATQANVPWKGFREMVTFYKANPGKLNFGVSAPNTVLLAHSLMKDVGIEGVVVPYSNATPLIADMIAGTNHMVWVGETAVPAIAARVQLLGISGNRRSTQFPNTPTFTELGLPHIPGLGYSVNAPSGTPAAVLARLNRAVAFAIDQPEVKARLTQLQVDVQVTGAEAANRDLLAQARLFSDVAARVGYVPQ
jgi:tripartite-type tricarboxylate transporter receptor subunit TctC